MTPRWVSTRQCWEITMTSTATSISKKLTTKPVFYHLFHLIPIISTIFSRKYFLSVPIDKENTAMTSIKSNRCLDEWHLNALKRINVHFKCVTCHAKVFPFTTATMFAASLSFVLKSSGSRGKAKTITFYYYLSWYWSKTLVPALFFPQTCLKNHSSYISRLT